MNTVLESPSAVWPLPVRGGSFDRADADILQRMEAVSAATACAKLQGMGISRSYVEGPVALERGSRVVGS